MCFLIRYSAIFSHHIFSKANIPYVCLGAARRHRPSGYTGTKRTSWTDGEWRTKGRVESLHVDGETLSELHLMFHHIVWLGVFLQGVEGALGPTGIIGPSGHPVCVSSLVPSVVHILLSGNDGAIVCLFFSPSGSPGWQRKSGGDGVWRRFW